ncbi:MAG: tetratricopeptide repeat protein, partial [Verrucomicrobia bacterium]|nr:tetratricopeptide repeat protein [Verrucomicrobiota bacterium]
LKPDFAEAHNNLGIVYRAGGRLPDAIRHFERALRLKPDYTAAQRNLRETRATMKRGMKDEG